MIVLSHNLHFLVDLNGRNDMRRADKKVVMIVKGINSARIERWELKREWMDKYKQSILKMEDFVNNPHPDKQEDAINGIRLTLELMLKLKFCKFLKDQNGTLGDLIADLEHSDCTFVNNNKADVIARAGRVSRTDSDHGCGRWICEQGVADAPKRVVIV